MTPADDEVAETGCHRHGFVRPGVNEDAREDQRDHRPCEEGDVEKAFDHWAGRFEGWQVETLERFNLPTCYLITVWLINFPVFGSSSHA